jgi:hypothetical protein
MKHYPANAFLTTKVVISAYQREAAEACMKRLWQFIVVRTSCMGHLLSILHIACIVEYPYLVQHLCACHSPQLRVTPPDRQGAALLHIPQLFRLDH